MSKPPRVPDYYEMLQVSPHAEQEVIEGAYVRLCKKYHPDLNHAPGATERMREINAAYEVLGDPIKRARYDGKAGVRGDNSEAMALGFLSAEDYATVVRGLDSASEAQRINALQWYGSRRERDERIHSKLRMLAWYDASVKVRGEAERVLVRKGESL